MGSRRRGRVEVAPPTTAIGSGQAGAAIRVAEETIGPITERVDAKVTRGDQEATDALIAAMRHASSPEELAERVVQYVGLRTVPGLRGLSADRIRREKDLFGAILELQTLRSRGVQPSDAWRLGAALDQIELFWTRPELLSDESVEDLTAQIRAVIADIGGPRLPDEGPAGRRRGTYLASGAPRPAARAQAGASSSLIWSAKRSSSARNVVRFSSTARQYVGVSGPFRARSSASIQAAP